MTKRNSGNPNPVITPEFEARKIPKLKGIDLAKRPLSIRFSVQTDAILREMPNHQQFVRDAVDAAIAKLNEPQS